MAFVKLYTVVQDSPVGYASVNQLAANAAEMRTQMFIEHGSRDPASFLSKSGGPIAFNYDELGHHNLTEIPRGVAKTLVFSQFAGFGTFSSGLAWTGPGIPNCYWVSTGVYFLPVVGLATFWGKATALTDSTDTVLEPQCRSLMPSITTGLGAGLQVSLLKLDSGDFIPADFPFTLALYGTP